MANVRPAQVEDVDHLVHLLGLLFTIEEDFSVDVEKQRNGLRLLVEGDRACVLVAEQDGQVIGMCTGQIVISTAEGGPSVLVEDVVVEPEYRGQGVGRALMAALTEWAKNQGSTRMQLLADKNNPPGLVFYNRLGWTSTALVCLRRFI
jgi:GNAT superfamily N-acetyltransferase